MTTPPTAPPFAQLVLQGFAAELAANPAATVPLAYSPDPAVTEWGGRVPIVLDVWPESRDGVVTITDYTVSDDLSLSDTVIGIQLTIRDASGSVVKGITDDVFNLMHGRGRCTLGEITLVSALRASGTNTGQDSNQRRGRIENYYLTVHRPSTNRL